MKTSSHPSRRSFQSIRSWRISCASVAASFSVKETCETHLDERRLLRSTDLRTDTLRVSLCRIVRRLSSTLLATSCAIHLGAVLAPKRAGQAHSYSDDKSCAPKHSIQIRASHSDPSSTSAPTRRPSQRNDHLPRKRTPTSYSPASSPLSHSLSSVR